MHLVSPSGSVTCRITEQANADFLNSSNLPLKFMLTDLCWHNYLTGFCPLYLKISPYNDIRLFSSGSLWLGEDEGFSLKQKIIIITKPPKYCFLESESTPIENLVLTTTLWRFQYHQVCNLIGQLQWLLSLKTQNKNKNKSQGHIMTT